MIGGRCSHFWFPYVQFRLSQNLCQELFVKVSSNFLRIFARSFVTTSCDDVQWNAAFYCGKVSLWHDLYFSDTLGLGIDPPCFPKPRRSKDDTTSKFPHSDRMMPFAKIVLVAIVYSGMPKAGRPLEDSLII